MYRVQPVKQISIHARLVTMDTTFCQEIQEYVWTVAQTESIKERQHAQAVLEGVSYASEEELMGMGKEYNAWHVIAAIILLWGAPLASVHAQVDRLQEQTITAYSVTYRVASARHQQPHAQHVKRAMSLFRQTLAHA